MSLDLNFSSTSGDYSYKNDKEDSKLTELKCARESPTNVKCVTEDTSAAAPNITSKAPSFSNDFPFSRLSSVHSQTQKNTITLQMNANIVILRTVKLHRKEFFFQASGFLVKKMLVASLLTLPRWRILQVLCTVCSGNEESSSWNSCQNYFPKLQQS